MSPASPTDHLEWKSIDVDGKRINYGIAGEGLPLLFVHGWALGQHSYKRALKRMVRLGCQVYAPALPGFGGSEALDPPAHHGDAREGDAETLYAYARWLDSFLGAVGVTEPVLAVGHSLGGAVVTKLAHSYPARVGYLVLVNPIGGGSWLQADQKVRSVGDRPLWQWGLVFIRDLFFGNGSITALRAMAEDAVPNLVRNPLGLLRLGLLARRADLSGELAEIKARGLPVLVLWGEADDVIPRASLEALCAALGSTAEVVPGRHSWLIADPDAFGAVMANTVARARADAFGAVMANTVARARAAGGTDIRAS
jgi:pimeloyl-ACP methyl ester carboxylesterase